MGCPQIQASSFGPFFEVALAPRFESTVRQMVCPLRIGRRDPLRWGTLRSDKPIRSHPYRKWIFQISRWSGKVGGAVNKGEVIQSVSLTVILP